MISAGPFGVQFCVARECAEQVSTLGGLPFSAAWEYSTRDYEFVPQPSHSSTALAAKSTVLQHDNSPVKTTV